MSDVLDAIDRVRSERGYRTVRDLALDTDNTFLDPFSTLVSVHVRWGVGNVVMPTVRIEAEPGACAVGDRNRFGEGTTLDATGGGALRIGDGATFGPYAVALLANRPGVTMTIGDGVRLVGHVELLGSSRLGHGAQVIGDVTAVGVDLAAGGGHDEPDPDRRGAVLKGTGRAVGLAVGRGEVVNGTGDFSRAPVERQTAYHPKAAPDVGRSPRADSRQGPSGRR